MADTAQATPTDKTMQPTPVQKKNSIDQNATEIGSGIPPPPMRKLSRSQSITSSAIPSNFFLPPDMEDQWRKRRESLDKLNVDKVAPWMLLHDFTEPDGQNQESGSTNNSS